jgi:uncharacterized protein (DUF433 family)
VQTTKNSHGALRALPRDDSRVSVPLYTISEAARILDVSGSTLHNWAHPPTGEPLITTLPTTGYQPTIPFVGLAEAFVIVAAKKAGVRDHRIRPSVEGIKNRAGGLEYALASKLVCTDGTEIFLANLEDDRDLDVPRTDQRAFRAAVESRLRLITYDQSDHYARSIRLPQYKSEVTLDPRVAGGAPLLRAGVGVRVKDIRDRVGAGDSKSAVARDFGIPLGAVKELVKA